MGTKTTSDVRESIETTSAGGFRPGVAAVVGTWALTLVVWTLGALLSVAAVTAVVAAGLASGVQGTIGLLVLWFLAVLVATTTPEASARSLRTVLAA